MGAQKVCRAATSWPLAILAVGCFLLPQESLTESSYYSPYGKEVIFEFQDEIVIDQYLYGGTDQLFAYFLGAGQFKKRGHRFSVNDLFPKIDFSPHKRVWKAGRNFIPYSYRSRAVLENGHKANEVIFSLPIRTLRSYPEYCTDPHFPPNSQWLLPHYVNFDLPRCQAIEGVHYRKIVAKVSPVINKKPLAPLYTYLPDDEGNIRVSLFLNVMNEGTPNVGDVNSPFGIVRESSRISRYLLQEGFKVTSGQEILNGKVRQDIDKSIKYSKFTPRGRLWINLHLSASPESNFQSLFLVKLKQALSDGHAYVGYTGHSSVASLGEEPDEPIDTSASQYQIVHMNSCNSYSRYLRNFEAGRLSGAPLDFISTAIRSFAYHSISHLRFVKAIHDWAFEGVETSYYDLITKSVNDLTPVRNAIPGVTRISP
jgi:hypothetical protein